MVAPVARAVAPISNSDTSNAGTANMMAATSTNYLVRRVERAALSEVPDRLIVPHEATGQQSALPLRLDGESTGGGDDSNDHEVWAQLEATRTDDVAPAVDDPTLQFSGNGLTRLKEKTGILVSGDGPTASPDATAIALTPRGARAGITSDRGTKQPSLTPSTVSPVVALRIQDAQRAAVGHRSVQKALDHAEQQGRDLRRALCGVGATLPTLARTVRPSVVAAMAALTGLERAAASPPRPPRTSDAVPSERPPTPPTSQVVLLPSLSIHSKARTPQPQASRQRQRI
jgi:hypothetical protein